MRINTRFPVAVHMLALTAMLQKKGIPITSDLLAQSVGTNPVVIRQMMSLLRKAGLIETKSGTPGCRVVKEEQEILLLDIYKAVQKDSDASLFQFHPHPNPNCFVGGNIAGAMEKPLRDAQEAMEQSLASWTLEDIVNYIEKEEWAMLSTVELCYFSPTGGTKKVGEILAGFLSEHVEATDMGIEKAGKESGPETAVIAVPVFGGRIPAFASGWLKDYCGSGRRAVTVAVYGNRAYEDALLELNDLVEESGAKVVASAAFVAQHSILPEVGAGRPDAQDQAEIREFAEAVLKKLADDEKSEVQVPGNRPYKTAAPMPATPLTLSSCTGCGNCEKLCPTKAIQIQDGKVTTDGGKCMLCMGCVAHCPEQARVLPEPLLETLGQKLEKFKEIRNKNEWFL